MIDYFERLRSQNSPLCLSFPPYAQRSLGYLFCFYRAGIVLSEVKSATVRIKGC